VIKHVIETKDDFRIVQFADGGFGIEVNAIDAGWVLIAHREAEAAARYYVDKHLAMREMSRATRQ
jgi:uncharacterized protein YbdZ (MbtH family)